MQMNKIVSLFFICFLVAGCSTAPKFNYCPIPSGYSKKYEQINFDYNSVRLLKEYKNKIKNIASLSQKSKKICVIGEISQYGDMDYNSRITTARVKKVASYLVDYGVNTAKLAVSIQHKDYDRSLFTSIRPKEEKRTVFIIYNK